MMALLSIQKLATSMKQRVLTPSDDKWQIYRLFLEYAHDVHLGSMRVMVAKPARIGR